MCPALSSPWLPGEMYKYSIVYLYFTGQVHMEPPALAGQAIWGSLSHP